VYSVIIMQENFKHAIKTNSKFYSIRRNPNIDYDIYHIVLAFPLNLTSIQKSPHNYHRPMGIHHSPHIHPHGPVVIVWGYPIPISMGIPAGISIPMSALEIYPYYRRRRCSPMTPVCRNVSFMLTFARVPWRWASNDTTVMLSKTSIFSAFGR